MGIIYQIRNIVNDKVYIGSSTEFEKRKARHLRDLRSNNHHSIYLQRSYNKHGEESFVFEVLEHIDDERLHDKEQEYLNETTTYNSFNVSKVPMGGDLISYHPNNQEIREKHKKNRILYWESLSPEEKEEKINKHLKGSKNPNFGNRWNEEQKEHMSIIMKEKWRSGEMEESKIKSREGLKRFWDNMTESEYNTFIEKIRQRMLNNNPFKGKTHTKETRKKLSQKQKERFSSVTGADRLKLHTQLRVVYINGTIHYGVAEAARTLNVSAGTICHRIKSNNPKFSDYYYIN